MPQDPQDTRERLLEAAESLFAEQGYDAVSIRDISQAAAVNIAAVNYHFQGKERLYREVLIRVMSAKRDRYLAAMQPAADQPGDLEDLLRAFCRAHFQDSLKHERGAAFIKLLVREVHHGDPEKIRLINSVLAPLWAQLEQSLLRLQPGLEPGSAAWIVGSLHGQLVHFTMRWLQPLGPAGNGTGTAPAVFPPLADDVDRYIDLATAHITRFSVAGIQALSVARTPDPRSPRKDQP
jgi:AcrR family transcriptional regulator